MHHETVSNSAFPGPKKIIRRYFKVCAWYPSDALVLFSVLQRCGLQALELENDWTPTARTLAGQTIKDPPLDVKEINGVQEIPPQERSWHRKCWFYSVLVP